MDRFAKLWGSKPNAPGSSETSPGDAASPVVNSNARLTVVQRVVEEAVDLSKLPSDPAQRRPISQFKTAKVRDDVRRAYLQKGPFQPKKHNFLQTDMSGIMRRFNPEWFKDYSRWLEYSIEDIGDEYFAILVDESRDVSHKEQMALVIWYVERRGFVMEWLIGLTHVSQTTSLALKQAIYLLLAKHGLSPSQIRGQGYDGASNMQGHLNGLKTLVMEDSRSAHSIHCFAHQLQLTLVAVAKNHEDVVWLFEWMTYILSTIGGSFKNRDMLREKQAKKIEEALQMGELKIGRGLNQELGLRRAGDTRWGSHFNSLLNMIVMFPSVIEVIDDIAENGPKAIDRLKAKGVLDAIQTFYFVFMMHAMKVIPGITNDLNTSLQRKDQDIVNAVSYLGTTKRRLQEMRNEGWEDMLTKVIQFCIKHDISLPDMDAMHVPRGSKSKRRTQIDGVSNEDYYQSVMYAIIDLLHVELNERFSETGTTLLLGMGCLDPSGSFSNFDKEKVLAMAHLDPDDFVTESKVEELSCQLDNFVANIREDSRFSDLKGIGELCQKLVEKKKHTTFPLVFLFFC